MQRWRIAGICITRGDTATVVVVLCCRTWMFGTEITHDGRCVRDEAGGGQRARVVICFDRCQGSSRRTLRRLLCVFRPWPLHCQVPAAHGQQRLRARQQALVRGGSACRGHGWLPRAALSPLSGGLLLRYMPALNPCRAGMWIWSRCRGRRAGPWTSAPTTSMPARSRCLW